MLTSTLRRTAVATLSLLLTAALLGSMGCGGASFGSELSAQPRPRPVRDEATPLRLPEAEPFSITLTESSRKPGLDGTAVSDARATRTGEAEITAAVEQSGLAVGNFQLGHAFENASDRQADFDFVVRYRYDFAAAATPESAYPDAQVGLKLYARGEHGRTLRDVTLVQHTTEGGPVDGASEDAREFTLTLGPGETVNVFLAGQVRIDIREGRSASGSLKVTDLSMEVAMRLAPAVRQGGDGQE
ncbi:MAG: hypothetical protein PVJ57_21955 [Phycisphaerae bacterium]